MSEEAEGAAKPLAGVTIDGRYTIDRVLERSSRAITLLATRTDIGQRVVVKVLRRSTGSNPDFAKRFAREIRATAGVQHPNVVAVFDAGTMPDGRAFYVMEHVEGRQLRDLIDTEAPVEPRRAFGLIRQLCAAISSAHAANIFHRDLHPGTILVSDRNGRSDFVTVADFSVARIADGNSARLTQTGMLLGTEEYLPPEKGDPRFKAPEGFIGDAAADVYAVGCIAFELLTGRVPLTAESVIRQFLLRKDSPPDWPDAARQRVPAGLREVVDTLLAADVTKRPGSGIEALRLCDTLDPKTLEWVSPEGPALRLKTATRQPAAGPAARPRRATGTSLTLTAPRRPDNTRTLARGMLHGAGGRTSLLLVRGTTDHGLFATVYASQLSLRPGQDVTMSFPSSGGGERILRGCVLGDIESNGRALEVYVELDRETRGGAYRDLLRRWRGTGR